MRFFLCVLLLKISFLRAIEDSKYVDFQPFINHSLSDAIYEVGALPLFIDYSANQFSETFSEFIRGDELDDMSRLFEKWSSDFFASEYASPWQKCNYRFGIFGGQESTHKKSRLIQGINCKMCIEFCDWIRDNHPEELIDRLHLVRLMNRLDHLDQICHQVFLEKIREISMTHPEINKIFYPYKGKPRLPISLRLIRFENSERFTLPLHFDISVLSIIFPSDDPRLEECLIIAPADGSDFKIEQLKRALRPVSDNLDQSCALLISGILLPYLNIPILPTPHGVMPHYRESRCVIVACLHIPNLDTSEQSTLLPALTEIPSHLKLP